MKAFVSISGCVCVCEWSGPVDVTMVVSLLSRVQQGREEGCCVETIVLGLSPAAAQSILRRTSTFMAVLPAFWAYCHSVVVACEGELLAQLRQALCGLSDRDGGRSRSLAFFQLLDDALAHVQTEHPHEVLELRRRRLRSGTWPAANGTGKASGVR